MRRFKTVAMSNLEPMAFVRSKRFYFYMTSRTYNFMVVRVAWLYMLNCGAICPVLIEILKTFIYFTGSKTRRPWS